MSDTNINGTSDARGQTVVAENSFSSYNEGFEYSGVGQTLPSDANDRIYSSSDGRNSVAKAGCRASEELIRAVSDMKIARLEHNISLARYRYTVEPEAAKKHEKRMNRHLFGERIRALKARAYESGDNKRYMRAIETDPSDPKISAHASPERIERYKNELAALLAERDRINGELLELYCERDRDFTPDSRSQRALRIRLKATRKAYKRFSELAGNVNKYVFAPDGKLKLFDLINRSIELYADCAVMRYRLKLAKSVQDKDKIRAEIANNKRERARLERNISSLVVKARRRTYLYGDGGIVRWAVGIAILIGAIIAAFCIFYEPISAFYHSLF